MPGGTPAQAAVRGLREETGFEVELVRLLGEDTFTVAAEVGGTTDLAAWIPIAEVAGLERVELVDAALGFLER